MLWWYCAVGSVLTANNLIANYFIFQGKNT